MAHLNVSLDFDSESEAATGSGWRVIDWLDDGSGTPDESLLHTNFYTTITEAQGAIEELFSSDLEVDQYFEAKAVSDLVGTSGPAIDSCEVGAACRRRARRHDGVDSARSGPTANVEGHDPGRAVGGTAVG